MYTRFKPSKSVSASKSLKKHNFKQMNEVNGKRLEKCNMRQVINEYGQICFKTDNHNKQNLKCSQNVYFSSSTSGETDQDGYLLSDKLSKRKQLTKEFPTSIQTSPISSKGSISSISLRKNLRQNFLQKQEIHTESNIILSRNISPKQKRQLNVKQFSTKTSIREMQQVYSSGEDRKEKSHLLTKRKEKKQVKDSTLQIAMKNMFRELKETRIQNSELKEQVIRIKSQQYYCLDREKVKEMILELEKEKQLRKEIENQNTELKKENSTLRSENQGYRRENCRIKRINARMKEQIADVKEENKILRQRAHQANRSDSESEVQEI